ncbi:MAG: ACT domain-containing protein, partial [Moraxellaceae bacterium]|nr:ACT domain-containing protein [Moraxellaceae bacterium]
MREILLVSIAGPDRAGISASLTAALAAHQVNILDVSQAVIHDQLTLGLVIETGGENDSALLMRAVLFEAHALGLHARFTPISADSYHQWVSGHGKSRHIVTLLARKITAEHLA